MPLVLWKEHEACAGLSEASILPGASFATSRTNLLTSLSLSVLTYQTRLRPPSSQGCGQNQMDEIGCLGSYKMFYNCCLLAVSSEESSASLELRSLSLSVGLYYTQSSSCASATIRLIPFKLHQLRAPCLRRVDSAQPWCHAECLLSSE